MSAYSPLASRVAIVTGAAQGLGAATAQLLAERGAHVVLADILEEEGKRTCQIIVESGGSAEFQYLDVVDEGNWRALIGDLIKRRRKVDILVNNAALARFGQLEEMSTEMFDAIMAVNVKGVFLGCREILPAMRQSGCGSIINISSIAGMRANMPGTSAYAASKGAVRLFTKGVAHDYARYGIRANSVHPGGMLTPMAEAAYANPDTRHLVVGGALNDRAADPREVAMAVAFLASDDASYMNGSEVVVDGGWLAH